MNRDNGLFLLVGLLAGFIAGYLLHEEMAGRQAPRRVPGTAAAAPAAGAMAAPGGGGGAAASGGAPMMGEITRLRQQIAQHPDDAAAIVALANLHFDIQDWGAARELYERYERLQPGNPDVITDLGVCLRGLGDFKGAIAQFQRAQTASPQHWQSRFNEVVVLAFDLKDSTGARSKLAELRRLSPDNPDVERLASEVERRAGAP